MNIQKIDELTKYLVNYNFNVIDPKGLEKLISGMTAEQILKAMNLAKEIQENLNSSTLGKELT